MARLLADENFPLAVVAELSACGHDVTTAQAEGLGSQPDDIVLAAATTAGRGVLTHDRDFIRLHRTNRPHAGIVFCSTDADAAALAARIDLVLRSGPLADQLLRVRRPSVP